MTELIRFLMVRSCVMTRTMHAWRKANAYVRSGQHDRVIYWLWRTQAILDADAPQAFALLRARRERPRSRRTA
jgi:hypothetical protein